MAQIEDNKMTYATASARWRAIVNRDAAATCFVYGVRTTKIYCRPRCPARLARRANVEFYDTPAQAEKAGYRPCKRCKPEDLRAPTDPHIRLAQKACETMTLAALAGGEKQRPTLQDLAGEAGLTPSHFHRVFKKVVGVTPGKFSRDLMERKSLGKPLTDGMGGTIGWPPPHLVGVAGVESVNPLIAQLAAQQAQGQHQQPSNQHPHPHPHPHAHAHAHAHPQRREGGKQQPFQFNSNPFIHATPLITDQPEIGPIDWNEFDMMLAATTNSSSNANNNNNNNSSNLTFTEPLSASTNTTATTTTTTTPSISTSASASDGYDSNPLLPLEPQPESMGFAEYMNDNIDFSLMHPPTHHSSPFDQFSQAAPSPQSVPSLHSQQSISPTDSPVLFDSYASLDGSPLLFDDVDWLDSSGVFQQDPLVGT